MTARVFVPVALLLAPVSVPAAAAPSPAAATPAQEDARLVAFLDAEFATELQLRPELGTFAGLKVGYDHWNDRSEAGELRLLQWRRGSVARLKAAFDPARLSPEGRANFGIWTGELERAELAYRFRRYQPPFYSTLSSIEAQLPNILINLHPVTEAEDMRAWVARVRAIPAALDTGLASTTASAAAGIRVPRFQVERIIRSSTGITTGAPFDAGADSPLWADAQAKVARLQAAGKLTPAEAAALAADARAAILALAPAYARVKAWATAALPGAPSGVVGAGSLSGGAAWYAAALRLNTTSDLSPARIHRIGRAEVTRIEAEQDALARSAGFADRTAFYADLAAKSPPTPWTDALRTAELARANAIVARNRTLLGPLFGKGPALGMQVIRESSFSEVAGGAAHASVAAADGSRPGYVYLHMLGRSEKPAGLATLMCHEAVPGHLFQGDIQVRQAATPAFRRAYLYNAFTEGWGLYAEKLCHDMGAFQSPAEDFMRLDAELFRAARLVTDTGLHAMGWSEDQAVAYMVATGKRPEQSARAEVRRYITNPGQATGYKIGMIRIMALRQKAEAALGARFDVRAFHDMLVGAGSLPLTVLDARVDEWIAAQRR